MVRMLPVIICGGVGTRIWPESRQTFPKQFIPLLPGRSTFQLALELLDGDPFDTPIIVTNADYRFIAEDQMRQLGRAGRLVLEPVSRNSGPAVAVAAELAAAAGPETLVLLVAADHLISDADEFRRCCLAAAAAAEHGLIVTLGLRPTFPATGYGYILPGDALPTGTAHRVARFVEKPDTVTAERYIAENYLWNSGNLVFRAADMQRELQRLQPEMLEAARAAVAAGTRTGERLVLQGDAFQKAPSQPIDTAVMERTDKAAVVPAGFGWSDLGTWPAVAELSGRDATGNSVVGQGIVVNASNVHVRSERLLTTVVGVDDIIVVTTEDAVLVLDPSKAEDIKTLIERMRASERIEAREHRYAYRPWGHYKLVDRGERYQVKKIVVRPNETLSLQKHFHRAEHWIVVAGTAEVTRDNELMLVKENESVYVPIGAVHRLRNPGKIDLELIEVQTGSYLAEDDIVRFDDVYHRV